jgi:UDP-N-acetylglucosamine--N-acetylmuramyl-(pentapeptide) pyrophosphoryl-undecaprenol N-acetylglucosamine transferase
VGLLQAAALVRRERPQAVLGVGGYAGGPVVLAAALLGVHTVILEPNARPGFTNRVLKPFVRKAACAWQEAREFYGSKGVVTGKPRPRRASPACPGRSIARRSQLLAFGGSQGSKVLNDALVAALPRLPNASALRIVHQTGEASREGVAAAYAALGREAEVVAFLDDMEARLAQADLVLCRSGATTCAELQVAGKAAILVPFARAADDHQKTNAQAMAAAGAAADARGEPALRRVARRGAPGSRGCPLAHRGDGGRGARPGTTGCRGARGRPRPPEGGLMCAPRSATSTSSASEARA